MIAEAFLVCALSVPAQSFHVPYQSEDALVRFLRACVPPYDNTQGEDVVYQWIPVTKFYNLVELAERVCPLGYLIADIRYSKGFPIWLRNAGWQEMPFYFKDKQIWRKGA